MFGKLWIQTYDMSPPSSLLSILLLFFFSISRAASQHPHTCAVEGAQTCRKRRKELFLKLHMFRRRSIASFSRCPWRIYLCWQQQAAVASYLQKIALFFRCAHSQ
jgi:hypothetical protein